MTLTTAQDASDTPTSWPIDLVELRTKIRALVELEEADEPVTSCYLDLTSGGFASAEHQAEAIRQTLDPSVQVAFDESLVPIRELLATGVLPNTRGLVEFLPAPPRP